MNAPPLITTTLVQNLITTQFPQYAHLPIAPVATQGHDQPSPKGYGRQATATSASAHNYSFVYPAAQLIAIK